MTVSGSILTQWTQDLLRLCVVIFGRAFACFAGVGALLVSPPGFRSCKLC